MPVQRVLKHGGWDAIIGFPPCTHLSNAGQKYRAEKLADGRLLEGYNFFMSLWEYPARCKALENPLGIVSSQKQLDTFLPGRVALQPSQIVCWTDFGDTRKKRTCLWLDGLPCLLPTTCRNERALVCPLGDRLVSWAQQAAQRALCAFRAGHGGAVGGYFTEVAECLFIH
jgi:hypothetical protein